MNGLRLWDEYISFLFHSWKIILFYIFTVLNYTLPIIDLQTEQALCKCCWHMFKHLASIICYLVNFSSWGAFLDGIWSRS